MALIRLDETKQYLRVDSAFEDTIIDALIASAIKLCRDIARLTPEEWADINSEERETERYTKDELDQMRGILKPAILYATAYLYEHREEADHHKLTRTLRFFLFGVREEEF